MIEIVQIFHEEHFSADVKIGYHDISPKYAKELGFLGGLVLQIYICSNKMQTGKVVHTHLMLVLLLFELNKLEELEATE